MTQENEYRNKKLVEFRTRNPKKWSFVHLGKFFKISPSTAFEIYHRAKAREENYGVLSKFISKKYPKLAEGRDTEDLRSV